TWLGLPFLSTAMALIVCVEPTLIAPLYALLSTVGSEPSSVYLIVPSAALSATDWADSYVPAATLAVTARGAVVSLTSRPSTVAPGTAPASKSTVVAIAGSTAARAAGFHTI